MMKTTREQRKRKRGRSKSLLVVAAAFGMCSTASQRCECFPLGSAFQMNGNDKKIKIRNPGVPHHTASWESFRENRIETLLRSRDDSDEQSDGESKKNLSELLSPMSSCKANQMSGTDLAYIGDVVFELFVRSRHVWPSKRTSDLQNTVVSLVRAEHQSFLLRQLKESFPLSEKENQVLMRGRNAVTKSKNRRNPAAYQDSTALEALIGYVYITDPPRCQELLAWLENVVDNLEG